MSKWNFTKEGTQVEGANTEYQVNVGNQPFNNADVLASKRNVILTAKGWVRRLITHAGLASERVRDEVLVAANPGGGMQYSSNNYASNPDIAQMYVEVDPLTVSAVANLYVVFNSPVAFFAGASANNLTLTVANTAGGNSQVATCIAGVSNTVFNANNTLKFVFTPGTAGTYQVNAQSISVTGGGNPLYNPDQGTTHAANLTISGAASNGLSTFTVV